MPADFTEHFAARLDTLAEYKFIEPKNGEKLRPGLGYVAPGDFHLKLTVSGTDIVLNTEQTEKVWGVRPSIDVTMLSAAPIFKKNCIGVILTGMGCDGTQGIQAIKNHGGSTYVQSLDEALISSMPEQALKTGAVDYALPVLQITANLNQKIVKLQMGV
jgi:two-component system chemotaxis response regulator CheB